MYSIVCLYLSYKQSPFSYYYDNPVMLDWGVVSQLTSNNHVSLLYCGSLFSVGHCSEIERGRGRVDQFPSTLLIVSCTALCCMHVIYLDHIRATSFITIYIGILMHTHPVLVDKD